MEETLKLVFALLVLKQKAVLLYPTSRSRGPQLRKQPIPLPHVPPSKKIKIKITGTHSALPQSAVGVRWVSC